jgi:DNA-binding MarR family transcriptional regulator
LQAALPVDSADLQIPCRGNICLCKYIAGMPETPPPVAFYDARTLRPGNSVGLLMKRVTQSLAHQIDRRLAPHDLTHAQWLPLYRIARGECDTMAALARDQALDPGAMTRALNRLEAKGLVRRERSRQDRRVVKLALTEAGRAAAQHVPPVLAEVLNGHLAGFSETEFRQLVALLERIVANGEALRDAGKDAE